VQFTIHAKGVTRLLTHNDNIEWQDKLRAWIDAQNESGKKGKKASVKGDDRSPGWTWIGSIYQEDGKVVIPSHVFTACIIQAAKKFVKKGNQTYKGDLAAALWLDGEYFPLLVKGKTIPVDKLAALGEVDDYTKHVETVAKLGFKLDVRRVGVNGKKHVRVRPCFYDWSFDVSGELDTTEINPELFERIVSLAGTRIGIGDWRPSAGSPGQCGVFEAKVEWKK
jgi:hypothetical protein